MRYFQKLSARLTIFLLLFVSVASASQPPNIILFLIDDLCWKDLGCQGSSYYQTPNIDALAKQGVRFTNAYSACAVCSPTRAAVLTGKYPARLMLTDWLPSGRWDPKSKLLSGSIFHRLRSAVNHYRLADFSICGRWFARVDLTIES